MSEPRAQFDPFEYIPIFPGRLRDRGTTWILLAGLVVFLVTVACTLIEGTFGRPADFRFPADVTYALTGSGKSSEPNFPLLRDFTSLLCGFLVVTGFALLHRNWHYVSTALTALRESRTIVPRPVPKSNVFSRLLGIDRLLAGDEGTALDRLDHKFGVVTTRTKIVLFGSVVFVSFIFATLLANGLSQNAFRVFAPRGVSAAEQAQWVELAKQNWWAGPEHPLGVVIYTVLAFLAMVLIFTFNVVGVLTVYFSVALYFAADLRADWYNRDGRFGWTPVARVYRTTYWALVLLGTAIAVLIAALGSSVPISVFGLILLYVLLAPVYTLVPWLCFRTVERAAKQARIAELSELLADVDERDLSQVQPLVAEFARTNAARIRPMRLRTVPFGAFATVVLLPIVLTGLQIFAQIGPGSR
ncbi:hypothetical protein [Herbidospora mongoliensis]|uniref:hypothetical protein n=1 Tax=Herbidospora mongoliensis TaxID=688067 RepID=UPI000836685D|nr:hypothetical protein [Herbidospora mongoliensis]